MLQKDATLSASAAKTVELLVCTYLPTYPPTYLPLDPSLNDTFPPRYVCMYVCMYARLLLLTYVQAVAGELDHNIGGMTAFEKAKEAGFQGTDVQENLYKDTCKYVGR